MDRPPTPGPKFREKRGEVSNKFIIHKTKFGKIIIFCCSNLTLLRIAKNDRYHLEMISANN